MSQPHPRTVSRNICSSTAGRVGTDVTIGCRNHFGLTARESISTLRNGGRLVGVTPSRGAV